MKIHKRIDPNRLPRHVAFIMDGNGRWAKRRGLPRNFGHSVGYGKMVRVVKRCTQIGIPVVSIYAFSTENWKRPKAEIDEIFRIVRENMERDIPEFNRHGIRVVTMGDTTKFPQDLQDKLSQVRESTKNNTRCTLNLCINYGGRAEIINAVNRLLTTPATVGAVAIPSKEGVAARSAAGAVEEMAGVVTEQQFSAYLNPHNIPDPDLVVRTSGEQRISNFMLWQIAYSEFLFIKKHWPSMNEKIIDNCIIAYQKRDRRFGKV